MESDPRTGTITADEAAAAGPRTYARLDSMRVHLGDAAAEGRTRQVIDELLEHRRSGSGRVIGLAGLPRHGKTKFAERLREHAALRPGASALYDKTPGGQVSVYYIPGRRQHHALIDLAGEDFQRLGDYDRAVPTVMERFLWPVLQRLDGLVLMVAFPAVWAGWNAPDGRERRRPGDAEQQQMRDAYVAMLNAHLALLKYTLVAQDLPRLRKLHPRLALEDASAPARETIDDAFDDARPLKIPVCVAFSKADLYCVGERPGLYPPGPMRHPPIDPTEADPLLVGMRHLPQLHALLERKARHFHYDFVQAFEDPSDRPDPAESTATHMPIDTLAGAESILEFVTAHPWRVRGLAMPSALRFDRMLNKSRWNGGEPRGGE